MSIQLVSRAKAAGVVLSPRDVFERQDRRRSRRGGATGRAPPTPWSSTNCPAAASAPMPLTPSSRGCSSAAAAGSTGSPRPLLVTAPPGSPATISPRAVDAVLDRHDMLRARLARRRAEAVAPWTVLPDRARCDADALIHRVPVSHGPGRRRFDGDGDRGTGRRADRLDPAAGVMVQVVWFDGPGGQPGGCCWSRITSWSTVCRGASCPGPGAAGRRSRPAEEPALRYRRRHVDAAVVARTRRRARRTGAAEAGPVAAILDGADPLIGSRPLDPAVDVDATVGRVTVRACPPTSPRPSSPPCPPRSTAASNDGLLTALALAVIRWRRAPRRPARPADVLINLEGHGREDQVVPGADLSRTVGWFTTRVPGATRPDRHRSRRRARRRRRRRVRDQGDQGTTARDPGSRHRVTACCGTWTRDGSEALRPTPATAGQLQLPRPGRRRAGGDVAPGWTRRGQRGPRRNPELRHARRLRSSTSTPSPPTGTDATGTARPRGRTRPVC